MTNAESGKNFITVLVELLGGVGVMSAYLQSWLKNTQRIRKNSTTKITVMITKKGKKPCAPTRKGY